MAIYRSIAAAAIAASIAASAPAQIVEGHVAAGGTAYAANEVATAGAIGEQIKAGRAEPVFLHNETEVARAVGNAGLYAEATVPRSDRYPLVRPRR